MEAVIAAVYLDGGLDAAARRRAAPARATGSASRRPVPAATTTRRGSRSSRRGGSTSCRATRCVTRGPTTRSASSRRCCSRGEAYGTGEGRSKKQAEQAAARIAWRTAAGRGDQRTAQPAGTAIGGGTMPELPEVEVVRRDLEREVVGKKIKAVDVDGMRSRPPSPQPQAVHEPARSATRSPGVERRGKYLLLQPRRRRRAGHPPRHVGPARCGPRARATRWPSTPTWSITFTQGGQLRFVDPRTFGEMFVTELDDRREGRHRARAPRHRPARDRDVVGALRRAARAAAREAEAAADGPEVPRRHRQHLQRRDPLGRGAPLGPHERLALARGGPPPLPFDDGDAAGRGEVPRVVARRRAVRRPLRAARRVPAAPQGVRARGRVVPALPPRRGARAASGRSTFFCSACQV